MKVFNDFLCEVHGAFELYVDMDVKEIECPQCMKCSEKVITGGHFKLEGITGHFPTASDKWADWHTREAKKDPKD